jgi:hypothetical protein
MISTSETSGRQTLIEEESTFKGSLDAKCPIVVNGRVEGELSGPSLLVNRGGAVQGSVKVESLRSAGELQGEFEANHMQVSGRVCDDTVLRAKSLEVKLAKPEEAPIVFGECEIEVGDAPTIEEALKRQADAIAPPKVAAPVAAKVPVVAKKAAPVVAKPAASKAPAADAGSKVAMDATKNADKKEIAGDKKPAAKKVEPKATAAKKDGKPAKKDGKSSKKDSKSSKPN